VVRALEAAVGALGLTRRQTLWSLAGYADLYARHVEQTGDESARRRLLQILDAAGPGSFRHCKVALACCAASFVGSDPTEAPASTRAARLAAMRDAALGANGRGGLRRAWQRCVQVHRLRYGPLEGPEVLRLLGETAEAAAAAGGREFCRPRRG